MAALPTGGLLGTVLLALAMIAFPLQGAVAQDDVPLLVCGAEGNDGAYQLIGRRGSLHAVLPERHAWLFQDTPDMQLTVSPGLAAGGPAASYCFSVLVPMSVEPNGDFYRSEARMGFNQCSRDRITRKPLETSYEVASSGQSVIKVVVAPGASRAAETTYPCREVEADEMDAIRETVRGVFSGGKLELQVPAP